MDYVYNQKRNKSKDKKREKKKHPYKKGGWARTLDLKKPSQEPTKKSKKSKKK